MKSRRIPNQFVSQFSRTVSEENGYVVYQMSDCEPTVKLREGELDVVKRAWARFDAEYKLESGK